MSAAGIVWGIACVSILATLACMWVTFRGSRRMYRIGWLEGRAAMVESMARAQADGVDPETWIVSEALADGIPIYDYADEDGKPRDE